MRQIPQYHVRGRAPASRSLLFSPSPHLLLLLGAVFILHTASSAFGDTFERRVSHDNNDAEEAAGGGISLNNDKMEFSQMGWVGFRFLDVTIPQGATIVNAYLEVKAADSNTESTDLTIFGQDADDTTQFIESDNDLSNRPRTSAAVDWSNVLNWSMNQFYQPPEITTLIQEIVDRGGWSSGSSMVILVRSDDLDGKRLVGAHDDSSSNAALLHIDYLCFTDVSTDVGFDAQTTTVQTHGSGFYWADYDNDGDLDAIVTGNSAKLMRSSNAGQSFVASSLGGLRRQGAMADLDNDGDVDFWAGNDNSYYAAACLLNNGSAAFSNVGDCGYSEPSNNEGVAAADVDGDGWCDIMQFSANGNWIGHNQGSTAIVLSGTNDSSYGLNDSGDFDNGDYCSAGDVNNDGYLDFFYHYGGGKLFLSDGDGTYTQNNYGISVVTGGSDKMGSAWGDYDNDGDIDLFVSRYDSGQPGYLWRNDGGSFSNVASTAGITDASGQRGCCWGDYDNDGDLDLYIVTHSSNANVLYQNQGNGAFVSVNAGADASGDGHDAVFVDYDNDGDLDLAVSQQGEDNTLLANGTDDTNYLKVRVLGHGAAMTNKAGVGVRVELYEANGTTFLARREIGVARGWAGAEPLWIHFGGLTNTTTYVVKVHFASGVEEVTVVPQNASTTIGSTVINQMLTVEERKPRVIRWTEVDPTDR